MSAYKPNPAVAVTGQECTLLAEAVEEVGDTKFYATIGLNIRASSNNESISPQILSYCFNIFGRPDFFDSLGYKQPYRRRSQTGNNWGQSGRISAMWSAYHPASGVETVWPVCLLFI